MKTSSFTNRLILVAVMFAVAGVGLLLRLVSFQVDLESSTYWVDQGEQVYVRRQSYKPNRGRIYDRDGNYFAVNKIVYQVALNPPYVLDKQAMAIEIARLVGGDQMKIYEDLTDPNKYWVPVEPIVSAEKGQEIQDYIDENRLQGVELIPHARRFYPQNTLAAHVIGYLALDEKGYYGLEGRYNRDLAGEMVSIEESAIPFEVNPDVQPRAGRDLVLTIDRDVQYLCESVLRDSVQEYGAESGTIIVMDPKTGEIMAMASAPTFNPNAYWDSEVDVLKNPAVSSQYEPGSIFKILTMAAALETQTVSAQSTYNDTGLIEVGGRAFPNWNRGASGTVTMAECLGKSLNTCHAWLAVGMGPTKFYGVLRRFGIGSLTGVDLEGEVGGTLYRPGDQYWSESNLGANAFGQGVAVTPIQMIAAASAIANRGLMMQPHIVKQVIDGETIYPAQPTVISAPISPLTAAEVREMMRLAVQNDLKKAQVPGYSVAGKSGTAEIPTPSGYTSAQTITGFIGMIPADDPEVVVLIKLDKPSYSIWGSETAAPTFAALAERLVVLLEIPNDATRQKLASAGGTP
jgi:cell division protein FtsI/penicillin-binding protein 2